MSKPPEGLSNPNMASSSQEEERSPLLVTLLSSEWRSSTDRDLSTLIRELAIQLAKHPSVQVSVFLPQCSEDDKRIAAIDKVELIEAEEMTGFDPVDWLINIPEDHVMDCIIGHGVHLGRQIPVIQRSHPCKWIQIVHHDPEALAMYKSDADAIPRGERMKQTEKELCELADQVVAIGPKLADACRRFLRSSKKHQDVIDLTPSIFTEFKDVKQATEERRTFCVLLIGSEDSEDFHLKGYDLAAEAVAQLKEKSYILKLVCAPKGKEYEIAKKLLEHGIDRSQLIVHGFNENRETLARLFCEVDLAIMPSRSEGFGLTALEALSAGLPVLVSSNSGLGQALVDVPNGLNCVVDSEDPRHWAKRISAVRERKRNLRLAESELLREKYLEEYSWQKPCGALVKKMRNLVTGLRLGIDVESMKPAEQNTQNRTVSSKKSRGSQNGNLASRRNTENMAIPLCLPNNWQWSSATGEYIKTGEKRSSLYVVDEALQKLRTVRGPVCVVSIVGSCRAGKSNILSGAFGQSDVFPLGHHFHPEIMGIWMWVVPQKIRDSNGQECTVVLLDSEGIDAVRVEGLDDNQIFTLTVLLASVLIYYSAGVPTRHDLNGLDFVAKLSRQIRVRTSNRGSMCGRQEDTELFQKTFPVFIWLFRNIPFPPDCKDMKEYLLTRVFKDQGSSRLDQNQEVAESILRFFPGFHAFILPPPTVNEKGFWLSGIEEFKELLRTTLIPKHSFNDGEIVTGEGLAAMVQLYVEAINTPDVIPTVQTAWETYVVTKCSEAANAALETYDAIVASRLAGSLPCHNEEIRNSHGAALKQGIAQLEAETTGISAVTTEKYLRELTEAFGKKLALWQSQNERLTRESCTSLLKQLKKEHLDPVLTRLYGGGGAKVMFDDLVAGYNRIKHDYKARSTGAKDVCAAVFFEFHLELMREMQQYFGLLRQLKDFDESLGREIAAKAYQKQEITKLEEEIARLQQENRDEQMEVEMLQAKQEEEKKRRRKQMEAEAKAQRDQMDNMIKANMKQAEEDRRAFIQENQALNQQLEMQELSEGIMQQRIANLRQLHQIRRQEIDASCSVM